MNYPYYEIIHETHNSGIRIAYETIPGGYSPMHWHEEVEMLFPLNKNASLVIDGKQYNLLHRQLIVIDSCQVHNIFSDSEFFMFLCIQISKKHLQKYISDMDSLRIYCYPEYIPDEKFPAYREICELLDNLVKLYMEDSPMYSMEAVGIVFQVFARLLRHFSVKEAVSERNSETLAMERIRKVLFYTEEHFREPISLDDITDLLGLGKEYFCRFFKKTMGISYLKYLNEVRLSHIYRELVDTDAPIMEIMENAGFSNQKLFNRAFKELYGRTPSSVRKSP